MRTLSSLLSESRSRNGILERMGVEVRGGHAVTVPLTAPLAAGRRSAFWERMGVEVLVDQRRKRPHTARAPHPPCAPPATPSLWVAAARRRPRARAFVFFLLDPFH
eukprot:1182659-Prorocentrum_minimum.AAC.4